MYWDSTTFSKIPPTRPTERAIQTIVGKDEVVGPQKKMIDQQKFLYKTPQHAIEVTDCFIADKIHAFNPLLVKIQLISLREKAVETTEYVRNYTTNIWSAPMEEKNVQFWKERPNIDHLMVRAKRMVYIPLTYATKYQPEIHGFVEESEFVSEGPTEWLIRQPFR